MNATQRLLVAASLTVAASAASSQTTGMKYISTPGDFIGGGQTQVFAPPQASIVASNASASFVEINVSDPSNQWTIDFAAPSGVPLKHGNFPAAQRYPFQSPMGAGLSMYGDGRGCNTLEGWFRVREYTLDKSGNVQTLAIDFLQNCEVFMPPLYGVVRINSKLPLTVPNMVSIAGPDFTLVSGRGASLDGTQSFTRKGGPLVYAWTQVAGPAVTLSDPASATPAFVAPTLATGTQTLDFRLTTTNAEGQTSVDDVLVVVEGADSPRTSFDFRGDPGDYISGGRAWHYDTGNSLIQVSRNADQGVSASIQGDTDWNFDTAARSGQAYRPGRYRNAQRFPFQDASAPGLSLYGDGRGCNTLTGQFTVYQADFDGAGQPQAADITFTQHCEGGTPASYGELLYNAVPHATRAAHLREARQRIPRP